MVFPADFLWGVSLSGFQFEMGDPSGRSIDPNTDWYAWVRDSANIRNGVASGASMTSSDRGDLAR